MTGQAVTSELDLLTAAALETAVDATLAAARGAEELRRSSESKRDRRLAESQTAREAARGARSFPETDGIES